MILSLYKSETTENRRIVYGVGGRSDLDHNVKHDSEDHGFDKLDVLGLWKMMDP